MTAPGNAKTAATAALTASLSAVLCPPAQAAPLTLAPLPSLTASVVLTPPAIALAPPGVRKTSASASLSTAPSTGTVEASASASLPPATAHLGVGVSPAGSQAGVAAGTPSGGASQSPRRAPPASPSAGHTVPPLAGSAALAGATTGTSAPTTARDSHAAGEETLEMFAARRSARARHRNGALSPGAGATAPTHVAASITRLASGSTPAAPTALPRSGGAHSSSGGGTDLPSLNLPPAGGEALEVALIVIGAMLLTALLFSDELKLAERYRNLRARLSHRRLG